MVVLVVEVVTVVDVVEGGGWETAFISELHALWFTNSDPLKFVTSAGGCGRFREARVSGCIWGIG